MAKTTALNIVLEGEEQKQRFYKTLEEKGWKGPTEYICACADFRDLVTQKPIQFRTKKINQ